MYNGLETNKDSKKTMSDTKEMLQNFMLDHNFTRTFSLTRPPAIGEEQTSADDHSNSSVSERSEVSNATPRRADVDLGYEPEGSASPLPAHERWKISLHNMLEDRDGVCLFKEFLKQINEEKILECWLAMKGFQDFGIKTLKSTNSSAASSTTGPLCNDIQSDEDIVMIRIRLASRIYQHYLDDNRGDPHVKSVVKTATKVYIRQQVRNAKKSKHLLDRDLFLQAQNEIERNVESNSYKKFLKSILFINYANQCDGVLKLPISGSPSTALTSYRLPRIPEEQVWSPDMPEKDSHNHNALAASRPAAPSPGITKLASVYQVGHRNTSTAAYPYYVTTAGYQNPAPSAVGSDQASKSSDTTDFTDNASSVDGAPPMPRIDHSNRCQFLQRSDAVLPPCPHKPRFQTCRKIPTMATDDPAAFFALLKVELEKLVENQVQRFKKLVASPDQDSNQILESHLSRVLDSPHGQNSPPNILRRVRHFNPLNNPSHMSEGSGDTLVAKSNSSNNTFLPRNSHHSIDTMSSSSTRKEVTNRNKRPSDVASINMGIVPGIPNNAVPDVPTPVIPVDKTQMISAWIQTAKSPDHSRSRRLTKHRQASDTFGKDAVPSFVNPANSTGLVSSSNKPNYNTYRPPRPSGLLAQDPTMPLLDQPDAGTTIEEVKRRLIEETEVHETTSMSEFVHKHMSSEVIESSKRCDEVIRNNYETDTDSNTTATTVKPLHQDSPVSTTVIYKLPNEKYPYKVQVPHYPLTLGHLKTYLSKQQKSSNFRFFCQKRSKEMTSEFEECIIDNNQLPLYDGVVRAKLEAVTESS